MTDARQWAELAREWLASSSPRAARAMQEREQEAARRRREWRPGESWRGKRADQEAETALARARWATEPETMAEPSPEDIEAAEEALRRAVSLARARARARAEQKVAASAQAPQRQPQCKHTTKASYATTPATTGDTRVDTWLAAARNGTRATLVTALPLDEFRTWLAATLAGVPAAKYGAKQLTDEQAVRVVHAEAECAALPLFLTEAHTLGQSLGTAWWATRGIQLVVVQDGATMPETDRDMLARAGVRVVG
ncbi:hypothetical protein [Nonomuraea sp. SYSU D8015]|uniref:hypothetical protein n=1 Tax=Nonomuraea sp. SYSU D8015 TaxID=2593644 RepID=UPI00166051AC|nr:hypothetical protein [Nonomuraea sp. SYSU D8015]